MSSPSSPRYTRSAGCLRTRLGWVAAELTKRDALGAHLEVELNISEEEVVSARDAAWVSAVSFTVGRESLQAILLPPEAVRVPVTFIAVLLALAALGVTGARLGDSPALRAIIRVVLGEGRR